MTTLFAHAGGLIGRSDLPIPEWLFGWAAAMVLVVSFVALAVLWPEPKLEGEVRWRPLPGLGRALGSRAVEILCGAIGVALLGVVVYTRPARAPRARPRTSRPTFVFVTFWIGLVPASVLFGDVFRAFNPWRAIGRAVGWAASRVARGGCPSRWATPSAWALARGRRDLRVRDAGAGALRRRPARHGRRRHADLLGPDVRRDGALRRRALVRARRGLLGLLQPVLAHLDLGDARPGAGRAAAAGRAGALQGRSRGPCRCWR